MPLKDTASTSFFVLHTFLSEIEFSQWAKELGDAFSLPEPTRLKGPSKRASSYMGRLFGEARIKEHRREVFHSFRSGYIADAGNYFIDV